MATAEESIPRSASDIHRVLLVGIGASAGGQDALERFLGHMPSDCGMAFVVVQHLPPSFDGLLLDLLSRQTQMAVCSVQDGMTVEPNRVYVIPPDRDLDLIDGIFHLRPQDRGRGIRLPIDHFFRSLARDRKALAAGIILSGPGTDGSLGLKAIKENGGIVLVQEPKSATSDAMPRNAISTGMVDFVLPPQEMPVRLLAYARHPYVQCAGPLTCAASNPESLAQIFRLLRAETGHDFSRYRSETLSRRIERRMALHQISRLEDYLRYLHATRKEVSALFRELLTGVTVFFRDPEAFAALRHAALRRLVQNRPPSDPVRVWVPGCATGEEAYSIAMLLVEQAEDLGKEIKIQIFGTDLDSAAIERARQAYFPASIAAGVGSARLQRFFSSWKDTHRVKEHLRGMMFFASHSIVKDPPFSHLDLISCRNLLIDLDPGLQKQVLAGFHRALNPGGFLFLGATESPEAMPALFEPVESRHRIFRRPLPEADPAPPPARLALPDAVEKVLLDQSPTSVAIDRTGEVLYIHGRTAEYLEIPPGSGVPSNLLLLARDQWKAPLRNLVAGVAGRRQRLEHRTPQLRLVVAPLPDAPAEREIFLVQFVPVEPPDPGHDLQAAREELQSVRQELATLHAEHETQAERLLRAEADLENTFAQTDLGIIFLDRDLNIRNFNPAATRFCELIPSDIGRPIARVASKIGYADIFGGARNAAGLTLPKEAEIETAEGRFYLLRLLPYRTRHKPAEGVALAFTDITEQKEANRILHSRPELLDFASGQLARVVRDSSSAIAVQDLEGRIVVWNRAAERLYGWSQAEALKLFARDLIPEERRDEALENARKLADGEPVPPFRTTRITRSGRSVEIWMTLCPLLDVDGNQYALAATQQELQNVTLPR
jgi:two-component system CheB/CheR fusion protein